MPNPYAALTFTDDVVAAQQRRGTRPHNERLAQSTRPATLGPRETDYIAHCESFFMATVNQQGWPYIQHRGGPAGFLRVLGPTQLGFADFRGNLQYLSVGNLAGNERVSLFLPDYAAGRRLKLLGRARTVEAADAPAGLAAALDPAAAGSTIEHYMLIEVAAFDWNCSQHIPHRLGDAEITALQQPLRARIATLETQLRAHGLQPLTTPTGDHDATV